MKRVSIYFLMVMLLGLSACGNEKDGYETIEETSTQIGSSADISEKLIQSEESVVLRNGEMLHEDFIYEYNSDGDEVYICQYVGTGGAVVVPETIDGYIVTSISANTFFECTNVISVQLPDGIDYIGREAFSGCTNLETVNLPEGIECLPYYLFEDCSSLQEITLPSTLKEIEEGVFYNCDSLVSVVIPEGVELRRYDMAIFCDCEKLTDVTFPTTTTLIPTYTFQDSGLTEFVIPEHITKVDSQAFVGCEDLRKLTVPSNTEFDMGMLYDMDITIYGEAGSAVEKEANSTGLSFVALE